MPFNFTNETLFAGAFILIVVIFIQYMVYLRMKKLIKLELTKKSPVKQQERTTNRIQEKQTQMNQQQMNQVVKQIEDDETYDVDTPEDDADSYVNPIHSEKNIDDTDDE